VTEWHTKRWFQYIADYKGGYGKIFLIVVIMQGGSKYNFFSWWSRKRTGDGTEAARRFSSVAGFCDWRYSAGILQKNNHRMAVLQHHPIWGTVTVTWKQVLFYTLVLRFGFDRAPRPRDVKSPVFSMSVPPVLAITADLRTAQWWSSADTFLLDNKEFQINALNFDEDKK
jgi:hypothetical protein